MNGDKDFENFVNKENNKDYTNSFITDLIKEKSKSILGFYANSLREYKFLDNNDPFKPQLKKFLNKIIKQALNLFYQFDYILLSNDNEEDNEEDNENLLNNEKNDNG